MKTAYLIEPRVVKRWFRNNQVIYDLVEYTEKNFTRTVKLGKLEVEFIPQKTIRTIFSSQDIEQVITIKQNLEK